MTKQELEELTGKFCDKYCRFPYICSNEKQLETVCDSCPMNDLFDMLDVIPPVQVGQEVYHLFEKQGVVKAKIKRIQINKNGMHLCDRYGVRHISEFGKTVFLTKEGAEQALKESDAE